MRSKVFYFLALCLFSIIAFNSCRKDKENTAIEQKLFGKWYRENSWDDHQVYHEEYNFTSDHHIEITGTAIASATHELKGYISKRTGTFVIKGDSLIVHNLNIYTNGGVAVNSINQLKFDGTYPTYSQKVAFFKPNLLYLIFPPCGPAADCIGNLVLMRK
jgi:hypothetical protein